MAEPTRRPDADDRSGAPRWVKVSVTVALLVVVLIVVVLLVGGGGGGGEHGPDRHTSLGAVAGVLG